MATSAWIVVENWLKYRRNERQLKLREAIFSFSVMRNSCIFSFKQLRMTLI